MLGVTPRNIVEGTSATIRITGNGFQDGATVLLDHAVVVSRVVDLQTITATAPPHAAGVIDLAVTNPNGDSATLNGGMTYNRLPPTVTSFTISGDSELSYIGQISQFEAIATNSDNSTDDVTGLITWTSTVPAVADISRTGLLTVKAFGETWVTATWEAVPGTTRMLHVVVEKR